MDSWINKSFSVQTNKAVYRCEFDGLVLGAEKWVLRIGYIGPGATPTGTFELPATWGRTMVFQFIHTLDNGKEEELAYHEIQLHKARKRIAELERELEFIREGGQPNG